MTLSNTGATSMATELSPTQRKVLTDALCHAREVRKFGGLATVPDTALKGH